MALGDVKSEQIMDNDADDTSSLDRKISVRSIADSFGSSSGLPSHELVYGELSVPVLATILDAVGVREGERFLDIGSGDGALTLAAALLYSSDTKNFISVSRGIEIVPDLVARSLEHKKRLENILVTENKEQLCLSDIELFEGNIYDTVSPSSLSNVLADTTLAVCFATTWSKANSNMEELLPDDVVKRKKISNKKMIGSKTRLMGRSLPKLSSSLASLLSKDTKVVIIDGRLDVRDGFEWVGDLKVHCPDTAPYSVASLYQKT